MARRMSGPSTPQHAQLTPETMGRGILRLGQCIERLKAFDPAAAISNVDDLIALASAMTAAVESALGQTFGNGTVEYRRYVHATDFSWPINYMHPTPVHEIVASFQSCKTSSLALLRGAVSFLEDELKLARPAPPSLPATPEPSRKVFVVHGHDEGAHQAMARFLEKIELEAIILQEQPDQGLTIIEKFESYAKQVGFAVVLLTPDDLGGPALAPALVARARQNVIFELGYFVGKLGRGRACLLRKGAVEIPSDLYGVIYTDMDAANGWKLKLVKELKAAEVPFNETKVLGA